MADRNQEGSHSSPIIIDKDEAWEIISNQITVQEQLRTRGQQILKILSAVAVIVAGTSLSFDYSISDEALENTATTASVSEDVLRGFLIDNQIISIFLLILAGMYFISFVTRNYAASRHSSLQPGLGGRNDPSIIVAATDTSQDLFNGNHPIRQYYGDWITSNAEILENKRQQLGIANLSLVLLVDCLVMIVSLLNSASNAGIVMLIYIDAFLILQIIALVIFYAGSRDEWWNLSSWPLTKRQKERFYFLNTMEFAGTVLFCAILLISIVATLYAFLPVLFD